ncbi:MAG: hypothetical protein JWO62_444 [Acidimicrobiaceae bacterium]|nr:hypothetical protein [Acidimicrobiaceae bacterium]
MAKVRTKSTASGTIRSLFGLAIPLGSASPSNSPGEAAPTMSSGLPYQLAGRMGTDGRCAPPSSRPFVPPGLG